ncbi:MAG: hypothetical protein IPK64_17325 [bacterium]|nr:hypothetical protein [bacterium]
MGGIVEVAVGRQARWARAAMALLALLTAAGCAGGGTRNLRVVDAPASAGRDSTSAPVVVPTAASPAADLARWGAEAWEDGRHAEAIALLSSWLSAREGAVADDTDVPIVRAALAVHHEALGQVDEAAAALAPCAGDDVAVARARTWLNLRGDGFASALADAERAVEQAPDSAADRNNHGIALLYAGRPAEAREAFLAARELDPDLPGALYNLAIVESVYFFDDRAARRWLAAYRRLSDEDPDGLFATLGSATVAAIDDGTGAEVLP